MNEKKTLTPFDVILGLGSNIGDKAANIREAVRRLETDTAVRVIAQSRLYRSPPWGVTEQDWFINACVGLEIDRSAREMLELCQSIELQMGRQRLQRWGTRNIDVDILTCRALVIDEPDLKVPHPLIAERAFVLVPLHEIAPDAWIRGERLHDLIARIDVTGIEPFASAT